MTRLNSTKNVVPAHLLWLHRMARDPRETAAELRARGTHQRQHHSHRPSKIKLSPTAAGFVCPRHHLRLAGIFSCHLCYSSYSTERTKTSPYRAFSFKTSSTPRTIQTSSFLPWVTGIWAAWCWKPLQDVHTCFVWVSQQRHFNQRKQHRKKFRLKKNLIQNVHDVSLHMA